MKELRITASCEIGDLIRVISERLNKPWDEVKAQAFKEYLFPESRKTFVLAESVSSDQWFRQEVIKILKEKSLERIYITEEI